MQFRNVEPKVSLAIRIFSASGYLYSKQAKMLTEKYDRWRCLPVLLGRKLVMLHNSVL
jgi:hypothetical protein